MLNISDNGIDRDLILKDQSAYQRVMQSSSRRVLNLLLLLLILGLVLLLMPWTQNVRSQGVLTTLDPADRQQDIHSLIPGRIEQWFVREGELLNAGDTIVFISEVKADYLDPQLLDRTRNQTKAKLASAEAYREKARALANQGAILQQNMRLKIQQAENYLQQAKFKVTSDSIALETAAINYQIAEDQYQRQRNLFEQGLKSRTDFELRKQKLQESLNTKVSAENNLLASQNQLINAQLNLSTVKNDFLEKIAKTDSDRLSALSQALEADGQSQKLSNQQANYATRAGFYYITAPQDGYVTQTLVRGLGETVKEGQPIFTFVPQDYQLAVELYVRAIDLPLIKEGNEVRLQFDGWPALVFNGWPGLSFGTFAGTIVAYDKVATRDGKFRVLVAPDPASESWPELLRLGSGAYGIALLKNVPVWYELWRNLNGFPPDFYEIPNGELSNK